MHWQAHAPASFGCTALQDCTLLCVQDPFARSLHGDTQYCIVIRFDLVHVLFACVYLAVLCQLNRAS